MGASRTTGWIVGTVVAVMAVLFAGWFLVAGPRFEAAAATLSEAEGVAGQNELLQLKIDKLRADSANLEAYRAEVAGLQAQIPTDGELADYTREVAAAADDSGAFLLDFTPGYGQLFTPAVVVAPVPVAPAEGETTGTEGTEATGGAEGTDATDGTTPVPAPVESTVPEGFIAVPFSARVVGTYAQTSAFLETLQTGTERLFLVTQIDAIRQSASEESPTRPATADGDVELTVSGFTYVLRDLVQPPVGEPTEEEPAAPLPGSDRNPFAPLPGTASS